MTGMEDELDKLLNDPVRVGGRVTGEDARELLARFDETSSRALPAHDGDLARDGLEMTDGKPGWPKYEPGKKHQIHLSALTAQEMLQIDAYRRQRPGPLIRRTAAVRELVQIALKAVGERLDRTKRLASRRAAALQWAASWRAEHEETFAALERAIATRSPETGSLLGHLKALDARAMDALPRIIEQLDDP